ncbi:hydroxyacylglutathione hydrolase [Arthroderma uncinatum]|uniref:hydroxyacylglutathione hydrolase n=1 Tax=Arthroderma uncinatum TaxID=74035 RepID=UPI00144ADFE9|nr:hydroxyacylglutathione hydrolase [Arthroderma uncinatum]KAF3483419.1 hydroxyacylglutathione hydrolase [Arthroderma uncinatum]
MHIESIPMWTGTGNNYAYLISDDATKDAMVVDPANPPEVIPVLTSHIHDRKINLKAIINTHHHHDHAGGNEGILKQFGKLPVIGGKDCAHVTQTPGHSEKFKIGERITVTALHTPCHTKDSICYFAEDGDERVVFTGDTLFIGGCGRFFEGDATQMHKALNEVLASLPDDTRVYVSRMIFSIWAVPQFSQSDAVKKLEDYANNHQQTQGKFTIGDEKLHNVFMRVTDPEVQKAIGVSDPVEVMNLLRKMKNKM